MSDPTSTHGGLVGGAEGLADEGGHALARVLPEVVDDVLRVWRRGLGGRGPVMRLIPDVPSEHPRDGERARPALAHAGAVLRLEDLCRGRGRDVHRVRAEGVRRCWSSCSGGGAEGR